ncbi:hypothetical protein [Halocatena marina]|nr:hypothetical protein [Halocatena marina]
MTQSPRDRVFIVTDGSSGIEEAITEALAAKRGHLFIEAAR